MNIRILDLAEKYLQSLESHTMECRLMDKYVATSDYEIVVTDVLNIKNEKDCLILTLCDVGYPKTITIWKKDYSLIMIY